MAGGILLFSHSYVDDEKLQNEISPPPLQPNFHHVVRKFSDKIKQYHFLSPENYFQENWWKTASQHHHQLSMWEKGGTIVAVVDFGSWVLLKRTSLDLEDASPAPKDTSNPLQIIMSSWMVI